MKLRSLHPSAAGSLMLAVVGVIVVIAVVGAIFLAIHHGASKTTVNPNANACVSKSFASGASGHCVSDIQNLTNNQAYGIDGQLYIKITGTYDAPTVSAVKTFQKNFNLSQTGKVTPTDWEQLCNSEESSTTFSSAAKDAGC